jgi:predicted ATPase/class 3 adenylate cyclase
MSESKTSFGDLLRQLRSAAALSQEALAERAGLSKRGISDLERGARQAPRLETVRLLADALTLREDDRVALLAAARPALLRLDVSKPTHSRPVDMPATEMASAGLPSGTVTVLFTDIEGSTVLWQQNREAMATAVDRYVTILRETAVANGGVLFKSIGDGTQCAFPSAPVALAAALSAQQALLTKLWPEPIGSLAVRMVLHAGEAEPDAHGNYLAAPLNRLSRLLEICPPWQILVSQTVQQLTREQLPAGASLRDLGEHRLRDLPKPVRVFQLLHPDLPRTFPSLHSLDALRHNLPIQFTSLVGREDEIQRVGALLEHEGARLVTLTGPGGTGKTRLALAVATDVLDAFPDGAWFVDLVPLSDPALVLSTLATTLSVRESGTQPLQDALSAFLAEKRLLLVLDNFEHLLPAASVVSDVLRAGSGTSVLVTSREPLRLRGEREVAVLPLPVPRADARLARDALAQAPAVALFVQRAQALKADFELTEENAEAVAAICRRLDGLPLAIELAAARIKLLPPQALLARLDRRLPVLTGGARDAPARQRTLRAAIAWSYDLLDTPEQALFRRLSVFAGGATLEAVEAVTNPDQDLDIFAGLSALVDKSLLRQIAGVGEPRFSMLETIREYAAEMFSSASDRTTVEQHHSDHYLAFAEQAKGMIDGPGQASWLARLAAEQDNMRAVLERAIGNDDAKMALRLGMALWRFWGQRGHLSEGRSTLERALAIEGSVDPSLRAAAMHYLGNLALDLNDFQASGGHFTKSLSLRRRLGDQDAVAYSLNGLGLVAYYTGDYASASKYFNEVLAIWSAAADTPGVAIIHHNLGLLAAAEGTYELARSHHREALALRRQFGNVNGVAYSLWALGMVDLYDGQIGSAARLFDESLTIFKNLGDRQGEAYALHGLARVSQRQAEDLQTFQMFCEVLELRLSLGERNGIIEGIEEVATVVANQGQVEPATRLLGAAAAARAAISLAPRLADRLEVEQTLAIARAALSESAFAETWATGQCMTLDQAIIEALTLSKDTVAVASSRA